MPKRRVNEREVDALFAVMITHYRQQAGMVQRELAEQLGITYQQYQKYESAANRVSIGRAILIADILRIPLDELLGLPRSKQKVPNFTKQENRLLRHFRNITQPEVRQLAVRLLSELSDQSDREES